jgi:hypothetical protein
MWSVASLGQHLGWVAGLFGAWFRRGKIEAFEIKNQPA